MRLAARDRDASWAIGPIHNLRYTDQAGVPIGSDEGSKRAAAHEAIERIRKLGMYESGCGLAEHLENQFVKKLGFRDLESLLIFMGLPADIGQVRGPHKERES